VAYPIPSLEPVTIATFPCNPKSIASPPAFGVIVQALPVRCRSLCLISHCVILSG
jgi:hypothetical protein